MILISDSMRAVGMEDGQYTLGGQDVTVHGALATLSDGTIAGSATNLYDCMCKAVEMGIPKEQVIRAATVNPAVSIGAQAEIGSLEVGKYANIVIADTSLNRRQVILKGGVYNCCCKVFVFSDFFHIWVIDLSTGCLYNKIDCNCSEWE